MTVDGRRDPRPRRQERGADSHDMPALPRRCATAALPTGPRRRASRAHQALWLGHCRRRPGPHRRAGRDPRPPRAQRCRQDDDHRRGPRPLAPDAGTVRGLRRAASSPPSPTASSPRSCRPAPAQGLTVRRDGRTDRGPVRTHPPGGRRAPPGGDRRDRRPGRRQVLRWPEHRLRFAMALLPSELLILDEPTTGMDVEGRREFWRRSGPAPSAGARSCSPGTTSRRPTPTPTGS